MARKLQCLPGKGIKRISHRHHELIIRFLQRQDKTVLQELQ